MRKQKINVIDLDKTLVKYDTFRVLVVRELRKVKFRIITLTFLRVAKLISSAKFKMKVQKYLLENFSKSFFTDYAEEIYQNINPNVMEIIRGNTDEETINILLSASPNEYVQPLCEMLNWKGSGSYFDEENHFHHLFGKEKINWIMKFYPEAEYVYHFAISDSNSDIQLLNLFEKKAFWNISK
jgi:phosphoserine phosphatase